MNSEINTDIFYKASSNKKHYDDVAVSSSIFTSTTPSKSRINDNTDSAYINNKLRNIHKTINESDFIPHNDSNNNNSTNTFTESITQQSAGSARYTSETIDIPATYSQSSTVVTPYNYKEYGGSSTSSDYSSTSNSSNSSDTLKTTETTETSISETTQSEKPKK